MYSQTTRQREKRLVKTCYKIYVRPLLLLICFNLVLPPARGINVTERSRQLLRDVRLRGGLKVVCRKLCVCPDVAGYH